MHLLNAGSTQRSPQIKGTEGRVEPLPLASLPNGSTDCPLDPRSDLDPSESSEGNEGRYSSQGNHLRSVSTSSRITATMCDLVASESRDHTVTTSARSTGKSGSRRVAFWVAVWGRDESSGVGSCRDTEPGGLIGFKTQTPEGSGFRRSLTASDVNEAERGGFEPPNRLSPVNGLANRRLGTVNACSVNNLQPDESGVATHLPHGTLDPPSDLVEVIAGCLLCHLLSEPEL